MARRNNNTTEKLPVSATEELTALEPTDLLYVVRMTEPNPVDRAKHIQAKNLPLGNGNNVVPTLQNLQQTLDEGNTATGNIALTGNLTLSGRATVNRLTAATIDSPALATVQPNEFVVAESNKLSTYRFGTGFEFDHANKTLNIDIPPPPPPDGGGDNPPAPVTPTLNQVLTAGNVGLTNMVLNNDLYAHRITSPRIDQPELITSPSLPNKLVIGDGTKLVTVNFGSKFTYDNQTKTLNVIDQQVSTPSLQEVLTVGAVSDRNITLNADLYADKITSPYITTPTHVFTGAPTKMIVGSPDGRLAPYTFGAGFSFDSANLTVNIVQQGGSGGGGTNSTFAIKTAVFSGDGTKTEFTLPTTPVAPNELRVGARILTYQNSYIFDGSTLRFLEAPEVPDDPSEPNISITYFESVGAIVPPGGGNTGTGGDGKYATSIEYSSPKSIRLRYQDSTVSPYVELSNLAALSEVVPKTGGKFTGPVAFDSTIQMSGAAGRIIDKSNRTVLEVLPSQTFLSSAGQQRLELNANGVIVAPNKTIVLGSGLQSSIRWEGRGLTSNKMLALDTSGNFYTTDIPQSGGTFTLKPATQSVIGGVKPGAGLAVQSDGTLYVTGTSSADGNNYSTSLAYNEGSQVLTMGRAGLGSLTVSLGLDNRYLKKSDYNPSTGGGGGVSGTNGRIPVFDASSDGVGDSMLNQYRKLAGTTLVDSAIVMDTEKLATSKTFMLFSIQGAQTGYKMKVDNLGIHVNGNIRTTNSNSPAWELGAATTGAVTANRRVEIKVNGQRYYIPAQLG